MEYRSSFLCRVDDLEAAVVSFGRAVAARRGGGRSDHHRAVKVAIEGLRASPLMEAAEVRRICAVEDVDFHLRHIDRLLESFACAPSQAPDLRPVLDALALALTVFETRGAVRLERLDRRVTDILAAAERPLFDHPAGSMADARLRRIALHVLAVGEASGFAPPPDREPSASPAA